MMPLPKALQGNRWTEKIGRYTLSMLVWCAQNGQTITYGQVDQEIVQRSLYTSVMAIQYRKPLGAIGRALEITGNEWNELIPPINALVVNQKEGLPGSGVDKFLERYQMSPDDMARKSLADRRAIIEDIHEQIFAYERWDDLLAEYGLECIALNVGDFTPKVSVVRSGWSSEGESEEHNRLKDYIYENPHLVGIYDDLEDRYLEYVFASGDRADVVFQTETIYLGVEVKSLISNVADLNRGIFQAVKYQALLRAEQKTRNEPPTARAVLVVEEKLPSTIQELADKLAIRVHVAKVNS